MPPNKKSPAADPSQQQQETPPPLTKSLLFNIKSQNNNNIVIYPKEDHLLEFIEANDPEKGISASNDSNKKKPTGKKAKTEPTATDEETAPPPQPFITNLHLYMMIDFHATSSESLEFPLYPIELTKVPDIDVREYRQKETDDEETPASVPPLEIAGFSTGKTSSFKPLLQLEFQEDAQLLACLDSPLSAYLVLSKELPSLEQTLEQWREAQQQDANSKKKPAKGKGGAAKGGSDNSAAVSRQKLDAFLAEHNALYLREYQFEGPFMKRFMFEGRFTETKSAQRNLTTVPGASASSKGKKKDAKKGSTQEDETEESAPVHPIDTTFNVALVNSPGGLLADVESSSYYLRIKVDKLDSLPTKDYESFGEQIKPLHVEYNYNDELHLTESFEQESKKKIKMNHEILIQFEKEEVEEWRHRLETEPVQFRIHDRDLKYLPLPHPIEENEAPSQQEEQPQESETKTTDQQDGEESSVPQPSFVPSHVTQYFATATLHLDTLASGRLKKLQEDIPLQLASEQIDVPPPKPKKTEEELAAEEEASKKGKGAKKKGKSKDPIPEEEEEPQPEVEYTENPIRVKQGHYLECGTSLRVTVQLNKALPEPNHAARVGMAVVRADPLLHQEAIGEIVNFVSEYQPETYTRPVQTRPESAKKKGKKSAAPEEEVPEEETVVNEEDYFSGVTLSTPDECLLIVEGLSESGIQKFAKFLQNLHKQIPDLDVLANQAVTFSTRRYLSGDSDHTTPDDTEPDAENSEEPPASRTKISSVHLSTPLAQIVNNRETVSNPSLFHAASNLLEFFKAKNIRTISTGRLWPSLEQLQLIHEYFGLSEQEAQELQQQKLEEQAQAAAAAEEDIPEDIQQESGLTDLYDCLGQDIVIDAIPLMEAPAGFPAAPKVAVEGEQERWNARRSLPGVEDTLAIVEDKIWVKVPSLDGLNAGEHSARSASSDADPTYLLVSLLPRECYTEPSFESDEERLYFEEARLPPYHLMCSFAGELVATNIENIYCILCRAWNQHASKKVDNVLSKELYPKRKKYTKNHFVQLNKTDLKQKSELIKRKRKLKERIEESKLHPLVREARNKVIEAAQKAPVYMYAGQRARWSEIQQATMREAMKQSKRKDNYTFSSGDATNFLSLSFSAISNKEVEETKSFRSLKPLPKDKQDFKYPAPRTPGTWTQPEKQLHPSKIHELRTTKHTSSNNITKLLEHNSGPLPRGKKDFHVSAARGAEFSKVPKLGFESDTQNYLGEEKEAERLRQQEKEAWRAKLVVDDVNFHVSHRSRNPIHVLDKRQTMLKDAPKKRHLKKKPLAAEPYSITSSDKYKDVTKRPFQEVLGVKGTRTQLPVTLGVRENINSFYVSNKQKDGFTQRPNYTREIKPLSAREKQGEKWGTSRK